MISPKAARDFLHIGALHIKALIQLLAETDGRLEHLIENVTEQ
jgi:hypothetical protein